METGVCMWMHWVHRLPRRAYKLDISHGTAYLILWCSLGFRSHGGSFDYAASQSAISLTLDAEAAF